MPRQRNQRKAPPLDPNLVRSFHDMILTGRVDDVKNQITSTPRLSNSKNVQGFTPLMTSVMSEMPWQTQVQLINILMERRASLATRCPSRCHVLLLACEQGAAPQVIDCLLSWSKKLGGVFELYHCDSNKERVLVKAARSGSLVLVRYLLSFDEIYVDEDRNEPILVVYAAISSGNEQLVLFVLDHKKINDEVSSTFEEGRRCIDAAYKAQMFDAVCEMEKLNMASPDFIWSCWYKDIKSQNRISEVTSEATKKIESIARNGQAKIVRDFNPALFPILLARSRQTNITNTTNLNGLISVPDEIFQYIAKFCFTFDHDALLRKFEYNLDFQENAEWCEDCDTWFLYSCHCVYRSDSSLCS